jgi:hypothetical protein
MVSGKSRIMLRYHLVKWNHEERLAELLEFCKNGKVDEVIFMAVPEEFSPGIEPHDSAVENANVIREAKAKLAEYGVESSFNIWAVLNHADRGGTFPENADWRPMVDYSGIAAKAQPCPRDEQWLEYILKTLRIYADFKPRIFFIDDDMRLHNHQPVRWGCFCETCLKALSEYTGRDLNDRETALRAIIEKSGADSARESWLKISGDLLNKLAREFSAAIRSVSSETIVGRMYSPLPAHSAEGTRWHEYLAEVAGSNDKLVRPHIPLYTFQTAERFWEHLTIFRQALAVLPPETKITPEVENFPFSVHSKSFQMTSLQSACAQFAGAHGITYDLVNFRGKTLKDEMDWSDWLADIKPELEKIAEVCGNEMNNLTDAGIGIPIHEDLALMVDNAEAKDFWSFYAGVPDKTLGVKQEMIGWSNFLQANSIAVRYVDIKHNEIEGPMAVCSSLVDLLSDEQLLKLLSGPLLLEADAARRIQNRGFGKHLGVGLDDRIDLMAEYAIRAELYPTGKMAGLIFWNSLFGSLIKTTADGVRVRSEFINSDREVIGPASTYYENELGGRIMLYALDGVAFLNNIMVVQQERFGWLQGWVKSLEYPVSMCSTRSHILLWHRYTEGTSYILIANCSGDPVMPEIYINHREKKEILREDNLLPGQWKIFKYEY